MKTRNSEKSSNIPNDFNQTQIKLVFEEILENSEMQQEFLEFYNPQIMVVVKSEKYRPFLLNTVEAITDDNENMILKLYSLLKRN